MDRTYCIFGDSITQAAYVQTGWAELFRRYLEKKHTNIFINVFNLGIGGNISTDLLIRFRNEAKARKPQTIFFQVGTNDSAVFKISSTKVIQESEFQSNLKKLIQQAKEFTEDIYFLSLALVDEKHLQKVEGDEKAFSNKRISIYDGIIQQIAKDHSCQYINIRNLLTLGDLFDGLHPNESGHQKIFEEVKKYF